MNYNYNKMEIFRTIFRHFRAFCFASLLNIGGLAVALTVFLVIVIRLHFEWGYDKAYSNSEHIFRIETLFPMSFRYSASSPAPLGETLKMQVPEIRDYFRLADWGRWPARVKQNEDWGEKFNTDCMLTSASIIDMLDIEILEGDGKRTLSEPGMFMIPESFAQKWFPGQSPIGSIIRLAGGKEYEFTIGAVYKDLPENSVFKSVCYTFQEPEDYWGEWSGQLFVLSGEKEAARLQGILEELPIEPLKAIYDGLHKEEQRQKEKKSYLKVVPLTEVYYDNEVIYDTLAKGNKNHAYLMLGTGLLVIFIALVNFANFTLSLAPVRMREVNTRKVLGASTAQLKMYFVAEAMMYTGIAYLIALLLIQGLNRLDGGSLLSDFLKGEQAPGLILLVGTGMLLLGGIVGYYPASYTTSFEPALVLKGNFVHTSEGKTFRNIVSVFQFTVSIVLIACTLLMIRQNHYMKEYTVGYQTENIGWAKLDQGFAPNANAIIEEIRQLSGVTDYTFSDFVPGVEFIGGKGFMIDDLPVQLDIWYVYYNFLQFFGIPLLQGDSISVYNQNQSQLLLNKKALDLFPVLQSYLGKTIETNGALPANTFFTGVTPDLHYLSLHKPVGALAMIYFPASSFSCLFFKLAPGDQAAVVQQLREIFERLAPESVFEFHFLDDTRRQGYEHEQQLTAVVGFLGGLAVFLALVGIYGMVVYQIQYRRREMAIRKMNGATALEILLLLNKSILYQAFAGFVLACPVAWYIMVLWLRNFSYHTDIRIWMFLVAGVVVLGVMLLTVIWQSLKAAKANPVRELSKE